MSMKYVDEYRNPDLAKRISTEIARLSAGKPLKLMEVCGGHTHTIYKHGVEDVLPRNIDLIHGPGCPVCVLPMGRIDDAIAIARMEGVIFTTFGDMMRVPGSKGSLLDAKAEGADVRFVYSPLDALKLARQHPDRQVVFFAIGFETTAPSTAVTLLRARAERVMNFSVFCNHVTIIPAMKAILDSPDLRLDGFIGPGHVSMVIGMRPYNFVAREHRKPVVIAGFEPLDIIQSIYMIVQQISEGRAEVENQYTRVVRPEGNIKALESMARTMELRPFFEWRGLGFITHSALKLRSEYADWDATPETPIGTCMVSPEGACAAYFNYGRFSMAAERNRLNVIPLASTQAQLP